MLQIDETINIVVVGDSPLIIPFVDTRTKGIHKVIKVNKISPMILNRG